MERSDLMSAAIAGVSIGATTMTGAMLADPVRHALFTAGLAVTLISGLTWILLYLTAKEKKEVTSMTSPAVTGSGTTVISIGQSGGVTAGTYINQAVTPELRILEQTETRNPDGSQTTFLVVQVVAPFTPGNLHIEISAQGITNIQVMPPPQGGISSIMMRNVRKSENFYSTDIPSPNGYYQIAVSTKTKTPINLNSRF